MGIIKPINSEVFSQLKRNFSSQFDGEVGKLKDALNQIYREKIKNVSGDLISAKTLDEIFKGKKDSTNEKNLNYLCDLLLGCPSYVESIELLESKEKPVSRLNAPVSISQEIPPDLQRCLTKHREKTKKRCGTIQILDKHQALPTIEIYTKTSFYNLDDRRKNDYIEVVGDLVDRSSENFQELLPEVMIDCLEEVRSSSRLLVLGRPGAGKTIFLKYLALRYIDLEHDYTVEDFGELLQPVYLPLRVVAKYICKHGLYEWLVHDISEGATDLLLSSGLDKMFKEGKFILFLDALDETSELFDEVCKLITDFLYLYPNNRMVITSRLSTYYPMFDGFKSVEVASFSEEQVEQFAKNWFCQEFKNDNGDDKEKIDIDEIINNFLLNLKQNSQASRLSDNPLSLTYLCMLYKGNYGFAKCEAEIFKDVADIFLRKWDEARNIRDRIPQFKDKLTRYRKFTMFALLAYEGMTQSPAKYSWRKNEIENWLYEFLLKVSSPQPNDLASSIREDAKNLLNVAVMDDGLLVPASRDYYAFPYISMQEYFVAEYMIRNSSIQNELIAQYLVKPNWEKVFLMLAELMPDSDDLFRAMFIQTQQIVVQHPKIHTFLIWLDHVSTDFQIATSSWRSQIVLLGIVTDLHISRRTPIRDVFALQLSKDLKAYNERRKKDRDNQPKLIISLYLAIAYALVEDKIFLGQEWYKPLRETSPMILEVLCVDESTTISEQIEQAIAESQEYQRDEELTKSLIALKNTLDDNNSLEDWKKWCERLKQVMLQKLNVGYSVEFTEDELDALDTYLYGNSLLLKCIMGYNISSPALRDQIVDSLLLPPNLIPNNLKKIY